MKRLFIPRLVALALTTATPPSLTQAAASNPETSASKPAARPAEPASQAVAGSESSPRPQPADRESDNLKCQTRTVPYPMGVRIDPSSASAAARHSFGFVSVAIGSARSEPPVSAPSFTGPDIRGGNRSVGSVLLRYPAFMTAPRSTRSSRAAASRRAPYWPRAGRRHRIGRQLRSPPPSDRRKSRPLRHPTGSRTRLIRNSMTSATPPGCRAPQRLIDGVHFCAFIARIDG